MTHNKMCAQEVLLVRDTNLDNWLFSHDNCHPANIRQEPASNRNVSNMKIYFSNSRNKGAVTLGYAIFKRRV